MEIRIICATRNLKINKDVKNFSVDVFSLSQDRDNLFRIIGTPDFVQSVGLNDLYLLEQFPYFVSVGDSLFYLSDGTNNEGKLSERKAELLQGFISCLWFIKDCCTNTDKLYIYLPAKKNPFSRIRTNFYSTSSGQYETSSFTLEELNRAKLIFEKLIPLIAVDAASLEDLGRKKEEKLGDITPGDFNYAKYNFHSRIQKAYMFLTMARSNSFLPLKISFYIGVYETLFTTDNSEVAHKVSERLSFYLGGTPEEKKNNYSLIKTAYGVRSKFIHGQKLDKNSGSAEKLIQISNQIDGLTRNLLTKIILDDSGIFLKNENDLNEYFTDMIFGNNT